MGTNYYVTIAPCKCCGRGAEDIHIGKSSAGWKFLFQRHGLLGLTTKAAWVNFLRANKGAIKDEYGERVTAASLISLIEAKQAERLTGLNCYSICGCSEICRRWNDNPTESIDPDGYRISNGSEFS